MGEKFTLSLEMRNMRQPMQVFVASFLARLFRALKRNAEKEHYAKVNVQIGGEIN